MRQSVQRDVTVGVEGERAREVATTDVRLDTLEAATLRRVTRRLLPLLLLLYVVCFIDRTNVSIAALQMNRDLGFSGAVYGLGSGIFFLGYALFEVPSNLILARVGARRWIGRIAITWGLLTIGTMFVRSAEAFYAVRFLLGVAEAGYFPGVVWYLGQWFPESLRARAMSRFAIGIPLASAVGGVLGGTLLGLDGRLGLTGWQWLFLVEGIPAVLLGVVAVFHLTDRPADARWLPGANRAWLVERLEAERKRHPAPSHARLRDVLASSAVWWLCLPYFAFGIGSYALALWVPTMIRDATRLSDQRVGLLLSLIGLASVVGMLLNGASSDRRGERIWHSALPLLLAAAGFAVALSRGPMTSVAGLALAFVGVTAFLPAFWCLPTALLRGTAAAGGIAFINSIGNLGGFFGPSLVGALKDRTGSFDSGLLVLTAVMLVAAIFTLRLLRGAKPR